jgi:fatty acid-binding protein DegV
MYLSLRPPPDYLDPTEYLLDTLKYLAPGGRIGKVQALLGSVLNVKPMLTLKDGVLSPAGRG